MQDSPTQHRSCPQCAEPIQAAAMKCRHCNSVVVPAQWRQTIGQWDMLPPQERAARWQSMTDTEKEQFHAAWAALGMDQQHQQQMPAAAAPPPQVIIHNNNSNVNANVNKNGPGCCGIIAAVIVAMIIMAMF